MDELQDHLNTANRHWWTVFGEIHKLIEQGRLEEAKLFCKDAQGLLKETLKG